MNGYLLDTHIALWWLESSNRIEPNAQQAISQAKGGVWLSAASLWEMAIKKALRQLTYPPNLLDALSAARILVLPVGADHALAVAELPLLHKDPFDRLLVSQARIEDLTIATRDTHIPQYGVSCIRA